ncbi:unnamed protein product [Protopolystoma xenopodis]|uniref:Uncharacterized protein n=1 Tax=Protopolystoma xenopodis TaxID=117903 RepID=A0A448WQN7_9PLAT|nr:unnamed protein product [Protopolystoma xenopodis]
MALKDAQNEIRLPEKSASMELDWPGNTGLECRRLNLQTGQQVGNWSQCFTAAGFSGHNRSSGSSHILKRTNNRGCSSKIINTDWAHVFEAANTATTSNYGSGGGLSGSTIGIGLASISPSNNGFRPHKGQRAGDGQAYISGPVGQVNEGFMKQSTLNATSGPSVRVLPDVASARMASSPMALAAAATAASGTNSGSLTRGNHISSRLNNNNHHQMARTSRMASHSGPSGLVIGPHGFQHQVNLALKAASLWSDGGTPFSAGNLMRLGVGPIGRVTGSVGDKNSIGSGGVGEGMINSYTKSAAFI